MTNNDYIAEYVKEKHSGLLGFDFGMWRIARAIKELAKGIQEFVKQSDEILDEAEEEEDESLEGGEPLQNAQQLEGETW